MYKIILISVTCIYFCLRSTVYGGGLLIPKKEVSKSECSLTGCVALKNKLDNAMVSYFSGKIAKGSYLVNSTSMLEQNSTLNYTDCLKKCTKNKDCFSLNHGNESFCELLKDNMYEHKDKLKQDSKWIHISMKSAVCDKNPCLNNGACVPVYATSTFKCVCAYGYAGKHCQISMFVPAFPNFIFDFDKGNTANTGYNSKELIMKIYSNGGKVVTVPDRLGKVLYCTGLVACIELTSVITPCLRPDFTRCKTGYTMSFWIKFRRSDLKGRDGKPTVVLDTPSGVQMEWHGNQNILLVQFRGIAKQSTIKYEILKAYKWNHIGIAIFPDESVKFYFNGNSMETPANQIAMVNKTSTILNTITSLWFDKLNAGSYFIDDLILWRSAEVDHVKIHYTKSKQ